MKEVLTNELFINILIILSAIIAYIGCISLYFTFKKKKTSKYSIEITVIAFAIILSTVFKTIIFSFAFKEDINGVNGIIRCIVSAFFSSIGGLQFEGLPLLENDLSMVNNNLITAYYVSSLWCGFVFLTLVSFAISVEFANACKLRLMLLLNMFKRNRHIYVFTAVTEDALTLANSIEQHHLKNKKEKYLIIFAGDIGAFDKFNPLCSKIFSKGYIYYSINPDNNNKTILEILKVSKLNNVSLFAFSLSDSMIADDQKNSEVVFSETDYIFNNVIASVKKLNVLENIKLETEEQIKLFSELKAKPLVNKQIENTLNFYVLTKNETNIREFGLGLKEDFIEKFINDEFIKQFEEKKQLAELFWSLLFTKIQINPINEADLAAKDFNKKRLELMIEKGIFNFENIGDDYYKVLSLGFGEKGRAVMTQLYQSAALVDYNGKTLPFFANIFDEKINNVSGTFLATHPMFVNIESMDNFEETVKQAVKEKLKDIYGEGKENMLDPNSLPIVKFNSQMCLSTDFFKYIDQRSGIDISTEASFYDAIIIALGEDILNIKLGNALIRDISAEYDRFNSDSKIKNIGKKFQFIGINIRNKTNLKQIENDIVNACKYRINDKEIAKTFEVITFGDAEEMYTYDNIIGNETAKLYAYRYSLLWNHFKENDKTEDGKKSKIEILKEFYKNYFKNYTEDKITKNDLENISLLDMINVMIPNGELSDDIINEYWKKLPILTKQSNFASLNFKNIYVPYLKKYLDEKFFDENIFLLFNKACKLEHERWMRFHIANGFKYTKILNKNEKEWYKSLKKHDNIIAFEELNPNNMVFDAIMIVMGFFEENNEK